MATSFDAIAFPERQATVAGTRNVSGARMQYPIIGKRLLTGARAAVALVRPGR